MRKAYALKKEKKVKSHISANSFLLRRRKAIPQPPGVRRHLVKMFTPYKWGLDLKGERKQGNTGDADLHFLTLKGGIILGRHMSGVRAPSSHSFNFDLQQFILSFVITVHASQKKKGKV
jgi:hypothetical protein